MSWNRKKFWIYDFNQNNCSPKKVFLCELEPFWSLLSKIHRYTYSKSIFIIQGVLEMDNAMKWLNIEIYDINHYSCFHKKKFSFLRWSLLGASCIKYVYTIIQNVFSPYRVSKRMENAMKLAKIWDIWLNSVHFLGHPVWWKYNSNKYLCIWD